MKKVLLSVASLALTVGIYSCGNSSTTLKSDTDTVSYAYGLMIGNEGVRNPQTGEAADSLAFLRGLRDGFAAASSDTTGAYAQGLMMASQASGFFKENDLSTEIFIKGIEDALKKDSLNYRLSIDSIQSIIKQFGEKQAEKARAKQAAERKEKFGANVEKGQQFIETFKKEEGVITTASGIAYKVLQPGKGATPTAESQVRVKYVGTTIDGKEFDRNDDIEFSLSGVIKGWTEVLQLMKVGEKVKVVIPYELAYGEEGSYSIEPYSTLVFEIELLGIK